MGKLNILLVTLALLAFAGQILSAPSRYLISPFCHLANINQNHTHIISGWPETLPPMKGAQVVAQEAAQGVKELRGISPGGVTRNR